MFRAKALQDVRERVAEACERASRPREDVTLIAVSKTVNAETVRAANDAGQRVFGENRAQESQGKLNVLSDLSLEWHFIGRLQTNKAKTVMASFDWIHAVDRPGLVDSLEKAGIQLERTVPVLVQVNCAGETQKGGVAPEELGRLGEALASSPHLIPRGLMSIPPFGLPEREARAQFAALRELGERNADWLCQPGERVELSMGMTSDFEWAIEEGATFVRVGTAIFGERV